MIKCRVLNEYGVPLNIAGIEKAVFYFDYEDGRVLEKKSYKVQKPDKGQMTVDLTEFEVQGLPLGVGQNFTAELTLNQKLHKVLFYSALHVVSENGRKVIRQ